MSTILTTLLVFDTDLVHSGELQEETPDDLVFPDIIFPKHIIPGYEFITLEVPEDFDLTKWQWIDGALVAKPEPILPETPVTPTP
jgi:hypothetical protein